MLLKELTERYFDDEYFGDRDDDYDDYADDAAGPVSFIVHDYDGMQSDDGTAITPFSITITYTIEDEGHTDHPYGSTTAREEHGFNVEIISAVTAEEVTYSHPTAGVVLKRFPKGTHVSQLPGWDYGDDDFMQNAAEEHANN